MSCFKTNSHSAPIQSVEYSNIPIKENESGDSRVSPNNRFSPYTPSSSRSSSISSVHSHIKFGTYNPMDWTSQVFNNN